MAYASGASSELIFVAFESDYTVPSENYVLAVSGSIPELGNWNLRASLIAAESYKGSGKWIARIPLPAGTCFEWKWVVIHREHYSAYRWEECENRKSALGKLSGRHLAPWNNAMVFNVDSNVPESQTIQLNLTGEHTTHLISESQTIQLNLTGEHTTHLISESQTIQLNLTGEHTTHLISESQTIKLNLTGEHTTPNTRNRTRAVSPVAPFSRRLFRRIFGYFWDTRYRITSTFEAIRNMTARSHYRRGGRGPRPPMEDERNQRVWV